jgi:hypothetical protein
MDSIKDVLAFLFLIGFFIYGLFMILGAMRNWRSFLLAYKRIDLIKVFGDFGRVLYVILGLAICTIAVLLFLKKMSIGPLVGSR